MADNDVTSVIKEMTTAEAKVGDSLKTNTSALEKLSKVIAKINSGSQKQPTGGSAQMPNSLANFTGAPTSSTPGQANGTHMMAGTVPNIPTLPGYGKGEGAEGAPPMPTYGGGGGNRLVGALAAVQGAGQLIKGGLSMMPDIQQTLTDQTGYYNAAVATGGGMTANGMRKAVFSNMNGGMTSATSGGEVANYLANRGMTAGSAAWNTTLQWTAGAAKVFNMENNRAAAAIEGLSSGTTSRNLLNTMGIYTSNLQTGEVNTPDQTFAQIAQRLTAGRGKASEKDIDESFRRGNLGVSLSGMGLDSDQQQLMVQYLKAQARGENMNLGDPKTQEKLAKAAGMNPQDVAMKMNSTISENQGKAADSYVQGMEAMLPVWKTLTDTAGDLAKSFGSINGGLSMLGASPLGGLGGMASGLGMMGMGMGMMGGGGGAAMGMGGVAGGGAAGGMGGMGGAAGMLGRALPIAAGVAGTAGAIGTTVNIVSQANAAGQAGIDMKNKGLSKVAADKRATDAAWANTWGNVGAGAASGAGIGAMIGSFIPIPGVGTAVGAGVGALIGGAAAGIGSWASTYNATMQGAGYGGEQSTINNNGVSGTASSSGKVVYSRPVPGKMIEGWGPRESPTGDGANTYHHGMDFQASEGTPVSACADGMVTNTNYYGELGQTVEIKHADGNSTRYCHLSRANISVGANVKRGQNIATSGNTGTASSGPHLHLAALNSGGTLIDPAQLLGSDGGGGGGGSSAASTPDSSSSGNPTHTTSGQYSAPDTLSSSGGGAGSPSSVRGTSSGISSGKAGASIGTSGSANRNGTSGSLNLGSARSGSYAPGASRAKNGRDYVANDGPINVHAGEAILTAEQAEVWRSMIKGGGGGKGTNITINVSVNDASDAEALKFANKVKEYLERDAHINRMGLQ
jgi:murein DD-endopeptidase MepM/ murein hydrolase activator NlpD